MRALYHTVSPRLLAREPVQRCDFPRCGGACCVHGVWVDLQEIAAIRQAAALIRPHLPADARSIPWFQEREEPDPHALSGRVRQTTVLPRAEHPLGQACVFWRPQDAKCALQVAAEAQGWHPWRLKPFYCILHPLDLDEQGRITLDDTSALLTTPGSCLRPAAEPQPLVQIFAPELRWFLGETAFRRLLAAAQAEE